jgi:hypothetical protein
MKTTLVLIVALLASACGQIEFYESSPGVSVPDVDASVPVVDAGSTVTPCYCCVWAPGTSYPNGTPFCEQGSASGKTCSAAATSGSTPPAWAPMAVECDVSNPWGKP